MRCSLFNIGFKTRVLRQKSTGLSSCSFFSSSCRAKIVAKAWTSLEDSKAIELSRQGLSAAQIALQMPDRSPRGVIDRLSTLRWESIRGTTSVEPVKRWTPVEDAILLEKLNSGLKTQQIREIREYLPGRTEAAIKTRYAKYLKHKPTQMRKYPRRTWTTQELRRLADMRITERLPVSVIAEILERTTKSVLNAWTRHVPQLVATDEYRSVRAQGHWTAQDDKTLIELRKRGMTWEDIAQSFPGKTPDATRRRTHRFSLSVRAELSKKALNSETRAIRRALEPVLDGTVTYDEVVKNFDMSSHPRVKQVFEQMRDGCDETGLPPMSLPEIWKRATVYQAEAPTPP
jgi:hypothetical protein